MLPSAKLTTESPWHNYNEAKSAFDKVLPNQTTSDDLVRLGFDPFKLPNIKVLTHLDIINRFVPNQSIRIEDLDPEIQACLQVKKRCRGYEITPEFTNNKRYGNLFLDLFNFRRKNRITGWRFDALIVIIDEKVVYKLSGGNPTILKYEDRTNPLGPLQDIRVISPTVDLTK